MNDELKLNLIALRKDSSTVLNHSAFIIEIENALKNEDVDVSLRAENEGKDLVPQKIFQAPLATKNNLVQEPKQVDNFIRVPLSKIDDLLNTFGEQVIYLSALDHYKDNFVKHEEEIQRTLLTLRKLAFDLQHSTMTLRMVNLKSLFSKLDRCIRDASLGIGKKVEAEFVGSHLELDKTIVDQISDPLIHIIRNAVDHGIEDNNERVQLQKNESGKVTITARREGGSFVIEIKDDGKGLDKDKILKKAQERGLVSENEILTEKEILELIFENGFSTKEQVSEFSGRGVGMNVVKEVVNSLKGTCEIESHLGKGTCFKIKLPLSLSLFNGLLIELSSQKFVVPSAQVSEIKNCEDVEIREVLPNQFVFKMRDEIIELCNLPKVLASLKLLMC
jgi:two-component system chemotaxis sensor kinase CheA